MPPRKGKRKAKLDREAVEEAERIDFEAAEKRPSKSPATASDDDDDDEDRAANEDLTLSIIEKSKLLRAAGLISECVGDGNGVVSIENGVGSSAKSKIKLIKKSKKVSKKPEITDQNDEEKDKSEVTEVVEAAPEPSPVETGSNNIVLRKLLRGPRYFDPPESSWGSCYNCGEEGHSAVQCTSARRKKPCFVCGSLEHTVKQCTKGRDCFICKKGGHRAKDCPDKYKSSSTNSELCLKCGDSGHDMFNCHNDYHPDDVKEIACYVCKKPEHLCCVSYAECCVKEDSCYRCGQLGHTGPLCTKVFGDATAIESCFKCGEGGHFARECPTAKKKKNKRNREPSTPTLKRHREPKENQGAKSAPHDLGKPNRKKKKKIPQHEAVSSLSTPRMPKQRGGWITEDPVDYSFERGGSGRRFPATPSSSNRRLSYATPPNGHQSNSHYAHQAHHQSNYHYGHHDYQSNSHYHQDHHDARYGYQTPAPRYPPSDYHYQNGHSGSRFGNPNSGGGSSGWNRGNHYRY